MELEIIPKIGHDGEGEPSGVLGMGVRHFGAVGIVEVAASSSNPSVAHLSFQAPFPIVVANRHTSLEINEMAESVVRAPSVGERGVANDITAHFKVAGPFVKEVVLVAASHIDAAGIDKGVDPDECGVKPGGEVHPIEVAVIHARSKEEPVIGKPPDRSDSEPAVAGEKPADSPVIIECAGLMYLASRFDDDIVRIIGRPFPHMPYRAASPIGGSANVELSQPPQAVVARTAVFPQIRQAQDPVKTRLPNVNIIRVEQILTDREAIL